MGDKEHFEEILALLPKEGFLKISGEKPKNLKKEEKVQLNRKGNELLNRGNIEMAQKIFLTTGYTDGLIRLGKYFYKNNQPLEALKMFWLAPYQKGINAMVKKIAKIINSWLHEDEKGNLNYE
ncbi:MAG: hypothetical protein JW881_01910 [Spirochaetales bacterium]|nr:hypothetical protein [Spirochaetales bacterium]